MIKSAPTATLFAAAFAALAGLATAASADDADRKATTLVDKITTQSIGTGTAQTCDNQGFLSTDCGPVKPKDTIYPPNALEGLNLGF